MISGNTWSAIFKTETGSLIPDGHSEIGLSIGNRSTRPVDYCLLQGNDTLGQKLGRKLPQNRVGAGSASRCRSRRTVIDNLSARLPIMWALLIFLLVISEVGTRTTQAQEPAKASEQVTSPEKFFGFQMGADRKMARWDKLVEYYQQVEKESDGRVKVVNMGPTEMGNPFLLVIITSAANQKNLEQLRQNNLKLADPRGLPEAEIKKIAAAKIGRAHV